MSRYRWFFALLAASLLLVNGGFQAVPQVRAAGWYGTGGTWLYRKAITIDYTKVSTNDQANFPLLVSLSADANLSANARSDGFDILFTQADGTTKLAYEREKYTSGALVAWVKLPTLSHTASTLIYMYYGNLSAADQQDGTHATWDANFKGVWHLKETPPAAMGDSTSGLNNGTSGSALVAGDQQSAQVDGGLHFGGALNADVSVANEANFDFNYNNAFTVSYWARPTSGQTGKMIPISKLSNTSPYPGFEIGQNIDGSGNAVAGAMRMLLVNSAVTTIHQIAVGTTGTKLNDGSWHYYVWTYSGSGTAAGVKLYQDGSALTLATGTSGDTLASNSILNNIPVHFGSRENALNYYNGLLDEVRISNTARGADWVSTEYNNQSAPASFYSLGSQETSAPATTLGDGISPANKTVPASAVNQAVSAFTLSTNTGTDSLTGLVVTGTNPGDVAPGGVKLYQDNGSIPSEWDAGDTLIAAASFSAATATFSGLSLPVTTSVAQYILTYDISASPANADTLTAVVSGATVTTNPLTNNDTLDATLTVDTTPPPTPATTLGDGTSPANKTVSPNATNQAVSAFTLSTNTGTDTLTGLVVTGTNPGNVAASGVRLYRDNGSVPNEWDATDTLIGTASFSGSTATFSGLGIPVTTSATQYIITCNISASPVNGQTLTAYVSGVTATNPLTNNDNVDATLTINTRPNIIFILTDDMAKGDEAYMPYLQSLMVQQGLTFNEYFVNDPLCCPSRATTLRGQCAHNTGVLQIEGNTFGGFDRFYNLGEESSTIATWLKDSGYRTGYIGKYLNGYPDLGGTQYVPPGWSEWYSPNGGSPYGQTSYQMVEYNGTTKTNKSYSGNNPSNYAGDVFNTKANDFISRAHTADVPFFLYINPYSPHVAGASSPAVPAARDANLWPSGLPAPRTPSWNEADVSDKPAYIANLPLLNSTQINEIDTWYRKRIQSLQSVDKMVNDIVTTLQSTGEYSNTYLVLTSDNGYHMGQHRLVEGKSSSYETDVHMPFFVIGPGVPANQTRDQLASNYDLAPTFAELAGVTPVNYSTNVDGRSLLPLLGSNPPSLDDWRKTVLISWWQPNSNITSVPLTVADLGLLEPEDHLPAAAYLGGGAGYHGLPGDGKLIGPFNEIVPANLPNWQGLRTQYYKYVEYSTGEKELYDLRTDPDEMQNLAATADPALLAELHSRLGTLKLAAGDAFRLTEDQPFTTFGTYRISGNAGVAGATLTYTGGSTTADGTGAYSFNVSPGWSGTVTPSKTGYTFNPLNRTYTNVTASQAGQDYIATLNSYSISGNAGVAGATIAYTGGSTLSGAGGIYSFTVPFGWSGSVTPYLSNYGFIPQSISFSNVTADQGNVNFTAGQLFTDSIPLVQGWNLISFNVQPYPSTAPGDVLSSLGTNYDLVYGWDPTGLSSGSGNWLKYDRRVGYGGSLTALTETQGFWINITAPDQTLNVVGLKPGSTTISLLTTAGQWNLVGFPSSSVLDMPGALTDHGVTAFSLAFAYHPLVPDNPWVMYDTDPTLPPWVNNLNQLTQGWGYWIYITAGPQTWTVAW